MATRSRIGLELADGSVISSYHHWDGGPNWLGRILTTHYNSKELAAELIDGGDMSSAWTNAGWNNETRQQGALYYSERGEDCPPEVSDDLDYFLKLTNDCGGEYAYVFANGEWKCYNTTTWKGEYGKEVAIPVPAAV
jgi:hypothetical protein